MRPAATPIYGRYVQNNINRESDVDFPPQRNPGPRSAYTSIPGLHKKNRRTIMEPCNNRVASTVRFRAHTPRLHTNTVN